MFLAPSGLAVLFRDTPFKYGQIDSVWTSIDSVVLELVAEHACASVVVVDAASVFLAFDVAGIQSQFLDHLSIPVIAFDVWNLPETDLAWDTGTELWRVPAAAQRFEHRLCPVPFIRPTPAPGRYNALPAAPTDPSMRQRARDELGLDEASRLVLTTTGTWQTERAASTAYHRHLTRVVPPLVVSALARLDASVRVLHVGHEPLATAPDVLADRYRWHERVAAAKMRELMSAADLLVTLNASATTISTAIALGLPVVLAINSYDAAIAPDDLRARVEALSPLHPFQVWPLGLHSFLAPVFADNPYLDAITRVELLDETAVVEACHRLLSDSQASAQARARMATYRQLVEQLPSALDVFDGYL